VQTADRPLTILCLSSYFKGNRFLETCKREGARVLLLVRADVLDKPWARDACDEVLAMPSLADPREVVNGVSYLARTRHIDRIAPLDDYDVMMAAALRQHFCLPGTDEGEARRFRDKLTMRVLAEAAGVAVPAFVPLFNHADVARFLAQTPGPWMLKPRAEAASIGIRKLERADELWRALEDLGDQQSYYLLERFVEGDVFHVDGIVERGEVAFAEAHGYHRPLFQIAHQGGVFATRTLPREDPATLELLEAHRRVIAALRLRRGVTHTEFIRGRADGKLYFLETAARAAGAHITDLVEEVTGVDLWAEWARLELFLDGRPYQPPPRRGGYGGLMVSLARQEHPDTSAYDDPEIARRIAVPNHVGFIVRSESPARVEALLRAYLPRIQADFQATLPPLGNQRT
jgi:biotin carboxylase